MIEIEDFKMWTIFLKLLPIYLLNLITSNDQLLKLITILYYRRYVLNIVLAQIQKF